MEDKKIDDKMSKADIGKFKLKFGMHKGKTFKEVETDYLKWMNEQNIFANDEYKWNKYIRENIV